MNSVDANYFDGRTSRVHAVRLSVHENTLALEGDGIVRREALADIRVSEPLMHAPRILTFSDSAFCEVADNAASRKCSPNRPPRLAGARGKPVAGAIVAGLPDGFLFFRMMGASVVANTQNAGSMEWEEG